jgi:hypothetical protein
VHEITSFRTTGFILCAREHSKNSPKKEKAQALEFVKRFHGRNPYFFNITSLIAENFRSLEQ